MAEQPEPERDQVSAEFRRVVAWRTRQLFNLGFDVTQVLALPARADIHHDADRLLKRGFSHAGVVELLKED